MTEPTFSPLYCSIFAAVAGRTRAPLYSDGAWPRGPEGADGKACFDAIVREYQNLYRIRSNARLIEPLLAEYDSHNGYIDAEHQQIFLYVTDQLLNFSIVQRHAALALRAQVGDMLSPWTPRRGHAVPLDPLR